MSQTVLKKKASRAGDHKTPSVTLQKAIDDCVVMFGRTRDKIDLAMEIGKKEGLTTSQVWSMLQEKMLDVGYTIDSINQYKPRELKDPRLVAQGKKGWQHRYTNKEGKGSSLHNIDSKDMSPEEYKTADVHRYSKKFLIKLVRYLEERIIKGPVNSIQQEGT